MADPAAQPSSPDDASAPRPARAPLGDWRFGLAVLVVGALAAGFAVAFRLSLGRVLVLASGAGDIVGAIGRAPLWARLLLAAAGGLLAGLVVRLGRGAGGGGPGLGDVMEAVALGRVRLSLRVTARKSLASWLAAPSSATIRSTASAPSPCASRSSSSPSLASAR
jgi:H+/Cl- antiporter ClcA